MYSSFRFYIKCDSDKHDVYNDNQHILESNTKHGMGTARYGSGRSIFGDNPSTTASSVPVQHLLTTEQSFSCQTERVMGLGIYSSLTVLMFIEFILAVVAVIHGCFSRECCVLSG